MSNQIETPVLVDTTRSRPASAQTEKYTRCHTSPATYGKREPDREGRARLQALLVALDASLLSLRRDFWNGMGRRGDQSIHGKRGHIYPDGDGYLLCVSGLSARQWSAIKRKLSFCQLRIDGDDEGTLHLDRLPTPPEAKTIRQVVGIRKRRRPSEEARPDLDLHFTPDISTVLAPRIHFSG